MGNIVKDYDKEFEKETLAMAAEAAAQQPEPIVDPDESILAGLIEQVKQKNKAVKKIFYTRIPYLGYYIFRSQTLADVRAADMKVAEVLEEKFKEHGGREAIEKMPAESPQRNKILRDIDDAVADASNMTTLKRCVLYPEDFGADVENEQVESGTASLLLEKIMDVSGWVDATIREV